MALAVCGDAGLLPAAIDLSHGAWGAPAWAAPAWGAPAWGAPAWGLGPAAYGLGLGPYGPSLSTSWGPLAAPYAAPYAGPTTAVHADPIHGHDGFVSSILLLILLDNTIQFTNYDIKCNISIISQQICCC